MGGNTRLLESIGRVQASSAPATRKAETAQPLTLHDGASSLTPQTTIANQLSYCTAPLRCDRLTVQCYTLLRLGKGYIIVHAISSTAASPQDKYFTLLHNVKSSPDYTTSMV